MKSLYAQVAVVAPIKGLLTYLVPQELSTIKPGAIVSVPLGKRKSRGFVFAITETPPATEFEIKSLDSIDAEYPAEIFAPKLKWIQWLAEYYFHPIGMVADSVLPPLSKLQKNTTRKRSPIPDFPPEAPFQLNPEQHEAYHAIAADSGFQTHLLYGVTGSGKTEVYLHLFDKVLAAGKTGLFLLPEISLTPQLVNRFARRFGSRIALLHSQLTDRERTQFWWEMVQGEKQILIGARSALFCPVPNLGLIVVDEEHESSFKQEEKLKYHGRDAAIMLAKEMNCPIVLGSATPSFESWLNSEKGKFKLHRLVKRVGDVQLPEMRIVDLKKSATRSKELGLPFWMSEALHTELQSNLENNFQSALFLNRRGMSQSVICPACGYTKECPNCDIKLTLHAHNHLVCHYCDYHESYKSKCSDCHEGTLEPLGIGTESVETEIKKLFPTARVLRVDRDEIQNRIDLENAIEQVEKHQVDILIGTQMIAKGLDFPNLKLVGLVLADVGFNLPDFRAGERAVQLILQMSGRAGRHRKENEPNGVVILQTFNPDSEIVQMASQSDYEIFCKYDLKNREIFSYPPYGKMISFRIQSRDLDKSQQTARMLSERCFNLKDKSESFDQIQVLGPTESPIAKIRNEFRFQIILKANNASVLHRFAKIVLQNEKWIPTMVKLYADVDPMNLL
ncbi:MAG: primosomal protein N' [Bdellovibrionaceae bacterium]|nr:primosomal protein N' [Pseudobdellovibrionaceae bacterium]